MAELWKSAVGFPDYEVSNLGHVRRCVPDGKGRLSGVPLKAKLSTWGYPEVALYLGGKPHHRLVSRLVCEAFNGPPPPDKPFALHADDIKTNNVPDNLYWGDRIENGSDAVKHGRYVRGKEHPRANHLSAEDIRTIRRLGEAGILTFKQIGERFGISKAEAHRITRRKSRGDVQ